MHRLVDVANPRPSSRSSRTHEATSPRGASRNAALTVVLAGVGWTMIALGLVCALWAGYLGFALWLPPWAAAATTAVAALVVGRVAVALVGRGRRAELADPAVAVVARLVSPAARPR